MKWCSAGAGFSSCTRMRERKKTDAAKVAESRIATAPPPSTVYSPAPASGAMIRRPSRVAVSAPVRVAEQLLRQHDLSSADAGGVEDRAERAVDERDRGRSATRRGVRVDGEQDEHAAPSRSRSTIISGRRRTRSARSPPSGASERADRRSTKKTSDRRASSSRSASSSRPRARSHGPVAECGERLAESEQAGVAVRASSWRIGPARKTLDVAADRAAAHARRSGAAAVLARARARWRAEPPTRGRRTSSRRRRRGASPARCRSRRRPRRS